MYIAYTYTNIYYAASIYIVQMRQFISYLRLCFTRGYLFYFFFFFQLYTNIISFISHLSVTVKFSMKIIRKKYVPTYSLLSTIMSSARHNENRKLEYLDWQCLTRNARCSLQKRHFKRDFIYEHDVKYNCTLHRRIHT